MRRGLLCLGLGALLLWPDAYGRSQEVAPESARPQSQECQKEASLLDITAARMTFDRQKRAFLFEENVRIRQCDLTILCDRVRVISDAQGDAIQHIVATGHVRMQQGTRHVVADRAEYFAAERRLVLTGNPRVWDTQQRHEITGDEMTLFLSQDRVIVKGARVRFHPRRHPSSK